MYTTARYLLITFTARITVPNRDVWSIDATVLVYGSDRYLVYSSWDGACELSYPPRSRSVKLTLNLCLDQCLYIAYVVFMSSIYIVLFSLAVMKFDDEPYNYRECR